MSDFITVKIEGLKGVEDALAEAGPKLAKAAMRDALKAGGEVFLEAVKERSPIWDKDTAQRHPGELRDSLTMEVHLSPKNESGVVSIGAEYKKEDGSQSPGVYQRWVEFGSIHNKPKPFIRPGFDATKDEALDAFTEVMKDAVPKLGEKS